MKKLIVLIVSLFALGCVTTPTGLDKKVADLEKRLDKVEMMAMAAEAAVDFYPARNFYGGAAGDLDNISSTENGDVGFVVVEAHATYGNALFVYTLDDASACGGDDTGLPPRYFQAADGGNECWELANIYAFNNVSPMRVVAHSAGSDTLTADEVANTVIYVTVAADFTLPEIGTDAEVFANAAMVPQGSSFCVHTVGAIQIDIDPHANNSITLAGVEDTNGHRLENTATAGDSICLIAADPNGWVVLANPDSWVAGGV